MRMFEIEEAHNVIKALNSFLIVFNTTKKSNVIIKEYILNLISELQDQEMLNEVSAEAGEQINFNRQIKYLEYVISILDDAKETQTIDKTKN